MASKDNPPPSGDNATLPKGIPSPSGGRNQGEQRKATVPAVNDQKEKCPRRPGKKTGLKARLAAFLETVSDSEDEGDGQPGNGPAPPPEE